MERGGPARHRDRGHGAAALCALTVFVSAFLLFLVQPLIARQILPWFGGSAAVWTVCLVFFQVVLLAGYAYADRLARCSLRTQAVVHAVLLLAACAMLPIVPNADWKPDGEGGAAQVLAVLAGTIGLPYLAVCTTGPLVQSWVARLHAGDAPRQARVYKLFALSNLAALVALVLYPFVLEPAMALRSQAVAWSIGFVLFAVLAVASVGSVAWRDAHAPEERASDTGLASTLEAHDARPPTWRAQLLWWSLSALGTLSLLAFSAHVTQDVASVPLLWILPLALYLLSFILSFDSTAWYRRAVFWPALLVAAPGLAWFLATPHGTVPIARVVALFCVGLFVVCMFCHGELARARPAPAWLTRFYLVMAFGGACGGLFAGIAAPRWFDGNWELPISLAMPGLILPWLVRWRSMAAWRRALGIAAGATSVVGSIAVAWFTIADIRSQQPLTLMRERNFYGTLRVEQFGSVRSGGSRRLLNGAIAHGEQSLAPAKRREPASYYGAASGVGLAIGARTLAPQRIGVIGLGVGTLAAYGRAGDTIRFYEINPLVTSAAHRFFSYLGDSAATIEIAQGDARLLLQRELDTTGSQRFDVLVVDAFTGDAIPMHLITREALALYRRHLRPGGVIAFHVSNRHLDLSPVVHALARDAGLRAATIADEPPLGSFIQQRSDYVLVTEDGSWLDQPRIRARSRAVVDAPSAPGLLWTDDHANLLAALRWTGR